MWSMRNHSFMIESKAASTASSAAASEPSCRYAKRMYEGRRLAWKAQYDRRAVGSHWLMGVGRRRRLGRGSPTAPPDSSGPPSLTGPPRLVPCARTAWQCGRTGGAQKKEVEGLRSVMTGR